MLDVSFKNFCQSVFLIAVFIFISLITNALDCWILPIGYAVFIFISLITNALDCWILPIGYSQETALNLCFSKCFDHFFYWVFVLISGGAFYIA